MQVEKGRRSQRESTEGGEIWKLSFCVTEREEYSHGRSEKVRETETECVNARERSLNTSSPSDPISFDQKEIRKIELRTSENMIDIFVAYDSFLCPKTRKFGGCCFPKGKVKERCVFLHNKVSILILKYTVTSTQFSECTEYNAMVTAKYATL